MTPPQIPQELQELLDELVPALERINEKMDLHAQAQNTAKAVIQQTDSLTVGMWDSQTKLKDPMENIDKVIGTHQDAVSFGLSAGYIAHHFNRQFTSLRRAHRLKYLLDKSFHRRVDNANDMFRNAAWSLLALRYKRDLLAKYEIDEQPVKEAKNAKT